MLREQDLAIEFGEELKEQILSIDLDEELREQDLTIKCSEIRIYQLKKKVVLEKNCGKKRIFISRKREAGYLASKTKTIKRLDA